MHFCRTSISWFLSGKNFKQLQSNRERSPVWQMQVRGAEDAREKRFYRELAALAGRFVQIEAGVKGAS